MNREREQGLLKSLQQAVIDGDIQETEALANKAVQEGIDPLLALEEGLGKGIKTVGDGFGKGEMFLPELIGGADAMQAGTKILTEKLKSTGMAKKPAGKIVIGTAAGDIHIIGKALVTTMLIVNGFEVLDIGEDKSAADFLEAIRQHQPDIVGISALLTISMITQKEVVQALSEADLRSQVKEKVGGGPVNQEWADEIGADAYGMNAYEAVTKAKALMGFND